MKGAEFLRELSLYFDILFLNEPGSWILRNVPAETPEAPGLQQPNKRRRHAKLEDDDWPPLTLLRSPGKNILALQCDHGENDSPFAEAGPLLAGLIEGPPIILHDSGSREPMDALARSVQRALLDAGGAWAQDHWQLLQAHGGGPLAVGLGSNIVGGRGKRPRAARLALAIVCRLEFNGGNESRHGGEEAWAPLNKIVARAQRLFAGAGAAPGP